MSILIALAPKLEVSSEFVVRHHIQSINGCPSLRVDARERDQNIFAIKTGQDIVKQAEPVRCLNLNKRINRMRFVIDCNPSWKFNSCRKTMALAPGSLD